MGISSSGKEILQDKKQALVNKRDAINAKIAELQNDIQGV